MCLRRCRAGHQGKIRPGRGKKSKPRFDKLLWKINNNLHIGLGVKSWARGATRAAPIRPVQGEELTRRICHLVLSFFYMYFLPDVPESRLLTTACYTCTAVFVLVTFPASVTTLAYCYNMHLLYFIVNEKQW